jgi:hypothetical protein
MAFKPGTVNKMMVSYAPWAVPIGWLHCEPQFELEQMETCPATIGNLPPHLAAGEQMIRFDTPINTHLTGDFSTKVTDPEADPLTYKVLAFHGPQHGKLVLNAIGTFDYDPVTNYQGEDRFYIQVTENNSTVTVFEVLIGVGVDSTKYSHTPHVSIDKAGVVVDQRYYNVHFPVKVSPAAQICEVWRLTVLQGAMDCDCMCYTRTDCFDIGIVKC